MTENINEYPSGEHLDEMEHDEGMARLQAKDQIEKLEGEVNDCECSSQVHRCPICWDKLILIDEIKKHFNFDLDKLLDEALERDKGKTIDGFVEDSWHNKLTDD